MPTNALVQESADLINWIDAQVGETTLPQNPRITTSAVLCSLGRQHHRAIIRLVESELPASAAALLRVIFECYVRAVWVHGCATDDEVLRAINDKWPLFKTMVQSIESDPRIKTGVLLATFESRWNALNGFTHNGAIALGRQIKNREIGPQFSDDEIRDIVRFSDSICLMIAGQIAVLGENAALAQALFAKVQEYSRAH